MGSVRGTARVVSALLMTVTMLAVLAQPAGAEPEVQIGTVCTDAGNRRIRLKQDTDLLVQWFLDGTAYLEPSTVAIILASVPGDGKDHVIELKEMPDEVVIATFEVTFELCDQPTVTTKPPSTTPSTTAKPTTTKQDATTASTTATTAGESTTTAQSTTSTTAATEPTDESTTSTTASDDMAIAQNGAEVVLGALAAFLQADDPAAGDPAARDADTDETSAQTLPPDDLLTPPPSLAASDDPSSDDGGSGADDGSMSGVVIIAIIGAVAAGLIGLLIGRRGGSGSPDTGSPTDGGDAQARDESLPSAGELLATRTGATPVFAEPARANEPLPQRQRSPKN